MRPKRIGIALLLATCALVGCGYSYTEHRVRIIDGETREPVQGALVGVSYRPFPYGPLVSPKPSTGTTDDDGYVYLMATCQRGADPHWTTNPPGYFRGPDFAGPDRGKDILRVREDIGKATDQGTRPSRDDIHVELKVWAKPEPTVKVGISEQWRNRAR